MFSIMMPRKTKKRRKVDSNKEKIFREILEEAKNQKREKPKNGKIYAIASIIIGIIGMIVPIPLFSIFAGLTSIYLAKVAIENGAGKLGRLGGIIGFIDMLWFFVSVTNLYYI